MSTQQEFLPAAMDELAMTRDAFSVRRAQGERSINGYCQPRQRTTCLAQGYPPARLNRRFARSPVDAGRHHGRHQNRVRVAPGSNLILQYIETKNQ